MSDKAREARYIHDKDASRNSGDIVAKLEAEIDKYASPEKKKKAAAVAIAAVIAAGGTAAAEVGVDYNNVPTPIPIVQDINELYAADEDGDKAVAEETQQKASTNQTVAKGVLAPIYAIGAGIAHFIDMAIDALSMPIVGPILQFLLLAAVVLGSLALTLKIAFPDIPLGEMLTKKRIGIALIAVAVISAACEIIPMAAPEAEVWVEVFKFVAGFGIVLPFFVAIYKVFNKAKSKLSAIV